ncbi:hypothetical protein [Streptomyces sp. NPDC006341]|uniref:hypothetical protein n=1 Tax=Streptomyces sp. NPDC006341 TaxID=3156756 RepID=UPI00339F6A1E
MSKPLRRETDVGFIRKAVVVVAGGVVLAGLTAPAGAAGSEDSAPGRRVTASPSAEPWVYCGVGWDGGLAVHVREKSACPTALKVAKAFYAASQKTPETVPVTVRVDGVPWKCESREGSPNPYIACVNQNNRSEQFQLNS